MNIETKYLLLSFAMCLLLAASASAQEKQPTKPYRVIFNCDGHAVAKDAEGDLEQWIENLFGPLKDSHVDALFWCDGAGGNTANYDSKVLERTGVRSGQPRTYIDRWIDEGNDPPTIVVREARKRKLDVFYSFRINDIHDSFIPDEMPTFKVEHPEWMLGEQKYGDVTSFKTALNFAVPEVRELKFRVIQELFQKYDFDGLEIDFLRSSPYFLPGTETKNSHLLTELLRRVRQHLNERARERGHSIRLAVRVNESLHTCRLDGYDVPTWIDESLVDIVTLGSGVMDIELDEFKKLAASKGIHIYPCLYGWPSKYNPITAELAAGLALNYHAQGADGIYLFNWFPHTKNNSESTGPYMSGLMEQLGDSASLRAGQRQLMFPADRGRPQRAYQYNWLHCVLPATLLDGKPVETKIRVFEPFSAATNLTLELEIDNLRANDEVAVDLNGKTVIGLRRDGMNRLLASIPGSQISVGINRAAVRMTKRADTSVDLPIVTALELHVNRDQAKSAIKDSP
ncbi:MAG: family 10 glycosylhydrolase [Planctomycetes bacterium]|nr:family 10 glycosylhydrolase [Planctomycetota bacterium]